MTMPPDWWRDFFGGLAADFWHAMPTAVMTSADVDCVLRLSSTEPPDPPRGGGARWLDVPCGDGRHAIELARRGFVVDGVDGSTALLTFARAAPANDVTWHHRDKRDLPWPAKFDRVACLGNSFGYLGDDGDLAFLRAVRNVLRPGGCFVLDAAVLEILLPVLTPRRWYEAGGVLFCSQVQFDPSSGIVRSDYRLQRGDEIEQKTAFLRVRSTRELLAMLLTAGFHTAVARDDRGEALAVGATRAWFVATV